MKWVVSLIIVLALVAACEPVQQGCTPEQALAFLEKMNLSDHTNKTDQFPMTSDSGGKRSDVLVPLENVTKEATVPPGPTPKSQSKPSAPSTIVTGAAVGSIPTKTVTEGQVVSFPNLAAQDPDGDKLSYTFSTPLDSSGRWQTKRGDAGDYTATITVSDGKSTQEQQVKIAVLRSNKAPKIEAVAKVVLKEGQILDLEPSVDDSDGDDINITFSGFQTKLPYNTSFDDAGNYTITITASDGELESKLEVPIQILNVNRAPKLDKLGDVEIREGDLFTLQPTAADPDKDKLRFTFTSPLNKTGELQTKRGDKGRYQVNVSVTDGQATDRASFLMVINSANQKPVLEGVKNLTAKEGDAIILSITAKDSDKDNVTIKYSGYMTSAEKRVGFSDSGIQKVSVSATDGIDTVSDTFTITIADVNRPPVFNPNAFK